MAKSEIKYEKKMEKRKLIPFLESSLNAFLGDPGWIIGSTDIFKVKVNGKDTGKKGSLSIDISWKGEPKEKKEKRSQPKEEKKEEKKVKEPEIPKKEKKKRGRPKKEKKEEPKKEWKPTKEDLENGKALYEKGGWRGLIKIYGSRHGKVIKDLVIPKKEEVKIEKKRGRPKKEKIKKPKISKKEKEAEKLAKKEAKKIKKEKEKLKKKEKKVKKEAKKAEKEKKKK